MDDHYCDIEELFHEQSARTTPQKHALLELLLSDTQGWTAKQLFKRLGRKIGDITTIHRNLNILKDSGIIHVALHDDKQTIYERQTDKHHDHLKCQKCGTYNCVPCPDNNLKIKQNIKVTGHQILYQGLCPNCT